MDTEPFCGEIRDCKTFTTIAVMPDMDDRPDDFRLIAAVPDLLEALETGDDERSGPELLREVARWLEHYQLGVLAWTVREKAARDEAAIARAKGESDDSQ